MKNLRWKPDKVLCIDLRDDLFTVAQMSTSPFMQFFDVSRTEDDWAGLDLGDLEPLFQVSTGAVVTQRLVKRVLDVKEVRRQPLDLNRRWIKPHIVYDGSVFRGGDLIEFDESTMANTVRAPKVKRNLTVAEDRSVIERTELTNMWGDQDLGDRLRRYFDTGVNRDDLKFEVFPGLWNDRDELSPLTRRLPVPLRGGTTAA